MGKQGSTNQVLGGRPGRKKKFCDLAYDSFAAFEKYINTYDCGIKYAPGKTCHVITKEERLLLDRYLAGERGLYRSNGHPFETKQFFQDVLRERHVHEQIVESKVYYYTSGTRAYGLAYLDVDAHHQFQTDADKALALLFDLFGHDFLFARDSDRGNNGYLKVWHGGRIQLFNETLRELQRLLHLFFRQNEILCDIEVKGTITTHEKCGSLAKLPFSTFDPKTGRQSWSHAMLADFLSKPDITLDSLVRYIHRLKDYIDAPKAEEFDRHVRRLKDQEGGVEQEVEYESLLEAMSALAREKMAEADQARAKHLPQAIPCPAGDSPVPRIPASVPHTSTKEDQPSRKFPPMVRVDNCDEPDSFDRQYWALLPLHRSLRRVATEREALDFIKANRLYTGDWNENLERRKARVRWILGYHAQTFDASKCGAGHVEIGKFDGWARANFARPTHFPLKKKSGRTKMVRLSGEDVATYLAVFDFCITRSMKGDKGVPHERVMQLWESLYGKRVVHRQAKDERVAAIREMLAAREVIRITNREYGHGNSMTYDYGPNYPGKEFWRRPKKVKTVQLPPFGWKGRPRSAVAPLPGPRASALLFADAPSQTPEAFCDSKNKNNNTRILNTVPTQVGAQLPVWGRSRPSTGPPDDP